MCINQFRHLFTHLCWKNSKIASIYRLLTYLFKLLPNNGVMKENRHITPFNFVFKWRNVLKWCNDSGASGRPLPKFSKKSYVSWSVMFTVTNTLWWHYTCVSVVNKVSNLALFIRECIWFSSGGLSKKLEIRKIRKGKGTSVIWLNVIWCTLKKWLQGRNWNQGTNGVIDFSFCLDVLDSVLVWAMSGDFHISVTEMVEVRDFLL